MFLGLTGGSLGALGSAYLHSSTCKFCCQVNYFVGVMDSRVCYCKACGKNAYGQKAPTINHSKKPKPHYKYNWKTKKAERV